MILVGKLGRDPEVRTTQTGGKVVTRSLATSESRKDRKRDMVAMVESGAAQMQSRGLTPDVVDAQQEAQG